MVKITTDVPVTRIADNVFRVPSRSGGVPHIVEVKFSKDGKDLRYVTCTCPAGRFGFAPQGNCWASKAVARELGIEAPRG